jgi:hypothetical protein
MKMNVASLAVLIAFACALGACERPTPQQGLFVGPSVRLTPAGEHVAINDGRSIEECHALGIVSATVSAYLKPDATLTPTLENRVAERGGNYGETTPFQCERGGRCVQSGVAYRCPASAAKSM